MPFVSVMRSLRKVLAVLGGFLIRSFGVARQAKTGDRKPGLSVLRDTDRAFWTRTVWRDEATMGADNRPIVLPLERASKLGWVNGRQSPQSWSINRPHFAVGLRLRIGHISRHGGYLCSARAGGNRPSFSMAALSMELALKPILTFSKAVWFHL